MNKQELIAAMADHSGLSKNKASQGLDAMLSEIGKQLGKGKKVMLVGFGTFEVRKRAARTGRNPQTGDPIKIKASKQIAFKAGKAFKDAV